jgi:acyl carrier protein
MTSDPENIFIELRRLLTTLFELEDSNIHLQSRLYEDLDLDSIDAVDLLVHFQSITKHKFQPEEFKAVKTIGDIVNIIHARLKEKE